jgi:serine/threonine-protein kinase
MDLPPSSDPIERRGRFRVERLIGRGGSAAVYEVVLEGLERRFALKVLLSPDATTTARLKREARALARLHHPHIVAPVDFGFDGGEPYLVMELVVGETLAGRLARVGRLDLQEIAAIFLPVCSALVAAHAVGIVHRDLKPSNIMLAIGPGKRLLPKVVDFGLARSVTEREATLTGGGVLGTVGYLSPEAARGDRNVTGLSDIYAVGVMLFECATGQLPFRGESAYEVMHAIVTASPAVPSTIIPGLSPQFDALVASAMARERSLRPPSAIALGRALLSFADSATRALWEPEFESNVDATGERDPVLGQGAATLTDQHLTAIGSPRSGQAPRLFAQAMPAFAAVVLGFLAWMLLRSQPRSDAESPPSQVVVPNRRDSTPSLAPPRGDAPAALATETVPTSSAQEIAPSARAPSTPISLAASLPGSRHVRPAGSSQPKPAASASPTFEHGANGALILE